jgi:hypothetical protein
MGKGGRVVHEKLIAYNSIDLIENGPRSLRYDAFRFDKWLSMRRWSESFCKLNFELLWELLRPNVSLCMAPLKQKPTDGVVSFCIFSIFHLTQRIHRGIPSFWARYRSVLPFASLKIRNIHHRHGVSLLLPLRMGGRRLGLSLPAIKLISVCTWRITLSSHGLKLCRNTAWLEELYGSERLCRLDCSKMTATTARYFVVFL